MCETEPRVYDQHTFRGGKARDRKQVAVWDERGRWMQDGDVRSGEGRENTYGYSGNTSRIHTLRIQTGRIPPGWSGD